MPSGTRHSCCRIRSLYLDVLPSSPNSPLAGTSTRRDIVPFATQIWMFSSGAGNYLGSCGTKALAAGRRRLATGQQSRDPTHVPIPPGGVGAGAAGGAEPGKFVSRVCRPGSPAVVAQVPSSLVGMELPAVNLKVAIGGAGRGWPSRWGWRAGGLARGGSPRACWAFALLK